MNFGPLFSAGLLFRKFYVITNIKNPNEYRHFAQKCLLDKAAIERFLNVISPGRVYFNDENGNFVSMV